MNRRGFLSLFAAAPVAVPALAVDALANPPPVMVAKSGAEIFRDFVIDGNPRSGVYAPSKADIREWMNLIEGVLRERRIIELDKNNRTRRT